MNKGKITQAEEKIINTPWGKIWTGVFGKNQPGIPLLVLHGGPGFSSVTEEIRELADTRPVYFYDQLGCGRSERPHDKSCYNVEQYVQELALIREKLSLREMHILAQSWGCMLAAEYYLRARPHGIISLTLSGTFLSTPLWEKDQRAHLARMPQDIQRVIEEAEQKSDFSGAYQEAMMAYYKKHVCRLDPWPDYLMEAFNRFNMDIYLTMWGPSEFTVTGTLKGADLTGRLPEINIPVLLVCGEYDEAGIKTVEYFRDLLPQGSMAVIPDASHIHAVEQPNIFRAILRSFWEKTKKA
ncbi:MAG TPA: proline iminopeptidase-family hydrolase [Smithellaceae bacterium]|nr:proline iminopeptidase-family hydrolase [Smithellaceae bacterium]